MRLTKYSLFTSINIFDKSNNIVNLMCRGGLIRKISTGIYVWLPNGWQIINNIIKIIRYEMNKIGALEILMPILQPDYLWLQSKRYHHYGKDLFQLLDRNKKLFILSPTHEELITKIILENFCIDKYPSMFYQIQTKFRDELRPRAGVIRSREFIMKDAYSFHKTLDCLHEYYNLVFNVYLNIFNKLGLNIFFNIADSGSIGGIESHEFHSLSKYGEDKLLINYNKIIYSYSELLWTNLNDIKLDVKNYCSEKILYIIKNNMFGKKNTLLNYYQFIITKLVKITYLKKFFLVFIMYPVKSKVNINKLYKIYPLAINIHILSNVKIYNYLGLKKYYLGPLIKNYPVIVDYNIFYYKNFTIGSGKNNYLFINVNWFIDIKNCQFVNICDNINQISVKVKDNIYSNNSDYRNNIYSSIELGHVFKLSDQYIKNFLRYNRVISLDSLYMGCYGIGITRLVAAIIDHYHDNKGIVWPLSVANWVVGIIPINMYNNSKLYLLVNKMYVYLQKYKIKVILDDRKLFYGRMLTDLELLGVPIIMILSNKTVINNLIEVRDRLNKITHFIPLSYIYNFLHNFFVI